MESSSVVRSVEQPPPLLFDATERQERDLEDNNYFVDADGNSYKAYSLAWRYLGMFIDCSSGDDDNNNSGDDDASGSYCTRKVLWAAYHDPGYKGGSIGEYSFYHGGRWDAKTCRAQRGWPFTRCQRMNCHEAKTSFELVGVFKETDGLVDWTEQLFKHQGYCLWGADVEEEGQSSDSQDGNDNESGDYNFMENVRQSLITACTALDGFVDADGSAIYVDTKPLPGGDMTYGLYSDAYCMTEASGLTWSDYLKASGAGDDDESDYSSASSLNRWNDLLSDYKVCQPCRAYSRVRSNEGGSNSGDSGSGSGDEDEEWGEDDGEGSNEQWGFDCNDDAGYQNCNQCYKFESQTDMEVASTADLEAATKQGTILAIKLADGTKYGKGQYRAPGHVRHVLKKTAVYLSSATVLVGLVFVYVRYLRKERRRVNNDELKDGLTVATAAPGNDDEDNWFGGATTKFSNFVYGTHDDELRTTDVHVAAGEGAVVDVGEKAAMLAMIQERDAKLSQQEELIEQLKNQIESYKTNQETESTNTS